MLGVLVVLCLALFFSDLGGRPLWDTDEGMHASTSRVMVETGDWVTPTWNGENFYDKPVLFSWLVALSFSLFGFTEFAARLPAALLGLGCVLLTFALGRRLFDSFTGFLAAVVLASSAQFIVLSRVVVHDIALAFCTTLALLGFWAGFKSERGRPHGFLIFWAASGLALLAKGPVGLLPGFVVAVFLLAARRFDLIRKLRPITGGLVLLAVAAPWYLAISLRNPDYLDYFLFDKVIGSLSSQDTGHARPIWWYLPVLLLGLIPWSVLLPAGLWRLARGVPRDDSVTFLWVWALAPLAVFSLASAKLPTYLLPLFPAFALLLARPLAELWHAPGPSLRRGFLWGMGTLTAVLAAGFVYVLILPPSELRAENGVTAPELYALLAVLVAGLATATALLARRFYGGFVASVAATMVTLLLVALSGALPSVGPYRSSREAGKRLDALLPPGEPIPVYPRVVGIADAAVFYTGRRARALGHPAELRDHLASPEQVFCLIRTKHIDDAQALGPAHIVYREGNRVIITNRPPGAEAGG